jgi:hypothetical protein
LVRYKDFFSIHTNRLQHGKQVKTDLLLFNMPGLAEVFAATGGIDENSPAVPTLEPTPQFLKEFELAPFTGANGSGPILNANANLLPTIADNYRDTANTNDFRLGNGLGISTAFRKPDSMAGQAEDGFQGLAKPNKLFGRSSVGFDLNWIREKNMERARNPLKKMGFKPNEVPLGGKLEPWQWQNHAALGIAAPKNANQYNRNYLLPDADAVHRRLYQPQPSRLTKMITTDVEDAALRPSRTLLHPMTVVTNDLQRQKEQRIPRNADVSEAVVYEKIHPRGMSFGGREAMRIHADVSVLRQPVGTNDTGNRAVHDRWRNGGDPYGALTASTLEDRLQLFKDDARYVRGQKIASEAEEFTQSQQKLDAQRVHDPNSIYPRDGEYPDFTRTGVSTPLHSVPNIPRVF